MDSFKIIKSPFFNKSRTFQQLQKLVKNLPSSSYKNKCSYIAYYIILFFIISKCYGSKHKCVLFYFLTFYNIPPYFPFLKLSPLCYHFFDGDKWMVKLLNLSIFLVVQKYIKSTFNGRFFYESYTINICNTNKSVLISSFHINYFTCLYWYLLNSFFLHFYMFTFLFIYIENIQIG